MSLHCENHRLKGSHKLQNVPYKKSLSRTPFITQLEQYIKTAACCIFFLTLTNLLTALCFLWQRTPKHVGLKCIFYPNTTKKCFHFKIKKNTQQWSSIAKEDSIITRKAKSSDDGLRGQEHLSGKHLFKVHTISIFCVLWKLMPPGIWDLGISVGRKKRSTSHTCLGKHQGRGWECK